MRLSKRATAAAAASFAVALIASGCGSSSGSGGSGSGSKNVEVFTCASGISPSGQIHIGNFRDIATICFVGQALRERGKVVPGFEERREIIKASLSVAESVGGPGAYAVTDDALSSLSSIVDRDSLGLPQITARPCRPRSRLSRRAGRGAAANSARAAADDARERTIS